MLSGDMESDKKVAKKSTSQRCVCFDVIRSYLQDKLYACFSLYYSINDSRRDPEEDPYTVDLHAVYCFIRQWLDEKQPEIKAASNFDLESNTWHFRCPHPEWPGLKVPNGLLLALYLLRMSQDEDSERFLQQINWSTLDLTNDWRSPHDTDNSDDDQQAAGGVTSVGE